MSHDFDAHKEGPDEYLGGYYRGRIIKNIIPLKTERLMLEDKCGSLKIITKIIKAIIITS